MADAAVIETLLIKIGADIVDLKKGVGDATKQLEGLDKSTKDTSKGMTANFAAAAAAVTRFLGPLALALSAMQAARTAAKAFGDAMADLSSIGRLAQTTGIAVQELSALQIAFQRNGIAVDQFTQLVSSLGPRLSEALVNPASRTAVALEALGVSVRTAGGGVRSLADVIPDLSAALGNMTDGANKTQLAAAILGEELGPKSIPVFNKYKDKLREVTGELIAQGKTATPSAVASAEDYKKAVDDLDTSISALVKEFAVRLAPAVTLAADAISRLLRMLPSFVDNTSMLSRPVSAFADDLAKANKELGLLDQALASVNQRNKGEVERLTAGREVMLKRIQALREELEIRQILADMEKNPPPAIKPAGRTSQDVLDADERARFAQEQLLARMEGQRTILDEMNFAWSDHADRVAQATEKIMAVRQTALQQEQTIARITQQLQLREQAQILETASMTASALTAVFGKSKTAAIGSAIINTAVGITNALSRGVAPWNWIQAGLIAATGAAQIAAIRSATESGGGNAPSVSGGGAAGGVAEEQTNRSITIQGIDRNALFSGTQMASLIDALNEETKRGSTLIATTLRPT